MKNRERGGHRLRRTHRRRLPVAMATDGKGEGIRAAQGVGYSPWACSRTVGWLGVVATSSTAAAERRSVMNTTMPATNHSGEGVIGFLAFWIGGGVAIGWRGRSWSGESARDRAAEASTSPELRCFLGADNGGEEG